MNGGFNLRSPKLNFFRIAGTIICIGLLVYLLQSQGWDQILSAVQKLSPLSILLGLFFITISRFAISARWLSLLVAGGINIKYLQSLKLTYSGLFASNFLPTTIGGDVVRLAGLIQKGFNPAISTASIITDRLVGMLGMILALPLNIITFTNITQSSASIYTASWALVPAALRLRIDGIFKEARGFIQKIVASLSIWLKQPVSIMKALGFTFVHMITTYLVILVLLDSLGESVPLIILAGLYSLVYFITLLPFSINGYGLQEISFTYILHNLAGVSLENSLTVSLLFRFIMMIASLPGAFFLPAVLTNDNSSTKE